jgi:AcrR family transcriptional regulator
VDSTEAETLPIARADRRKAESRQRLLAAARKLFTEQGYHATRPQDIAREADVGHGTFYLHFADKRACFLAFAEEAQAELSAFVARRLAGVAEIEAQLRALMAALLDYAEEHRGVIKAAMTDVSVISSAAEDACGSTLVDRWAAQWAAHLGDAARRGAMHADYDPAVIGHAIVGLFRGAAACGIRGIAEREAVIDSVTRFLVRALVPNPSSPGDAKP